VRKYLPVAALILVIPGFLSAYDSISADLFSSLINTRDSVVIIDVREPLEFDSGHIDGAHLYPLNSGVLADRSGQLPAGFDLFVHCGSGFRSAEAAALLDTVGDGMYAGRVYNLTGGVGSWPYSLVGGEQEGPAVAVSVDSLIFGATTPGSVAKMSIALHNRGSQGAAVVVCSLESAEFEVTPVLTAVTPGDSVILTVSFDPAGKTECLDTLFLVRGGAGRNPLGIPLAGSAAGLTGDIDDNGSVDIFDLLELLKSLRESGASNERMDINSDGAVNIFDLLELLKLLRER
jgi:rhodanese-related sulfurtransferase